MARRIGLTLNSEKKPEKDKKPAEKKPDKEKEAK